MASTFQLFFRCSQRKRSTGFLTQGLSERSVIRLQVLPRSRLARRPEVRVDVSHGYQAKRPRRTFVHNAGTCRFLLSGAFPEGALVCPLVGILSCKSCGRTAAFRPSRQCRSRIPFDCKLLASRRSLSHFPSVRTELSQCRAIVSRADANRAARHFRAGCAFTRVVMLDSRC